jgi:hypothetical protein
MAAVRGALGFTMLTQPQLAAKMLGAAPGGRHPVLRLLGLRHVTEASVLMVRPTQPVTALGVVVDATHVASCLAFAAVSPRHRRPAMRDAALAAVVLVATWSTRPRVPAQQPQVPTPLRLVDARSAIGAHLVLPAGGSAPVGSPASHGLETVFPLPLGRVVIGRGREVDLDLTDPTIAAQHLCITHSNSGTLLEDLGTLNGTRVNGIPVSATKLQAGDRIEIGNSTLVYNWPPPSESR